VATPASSPAKAAMQWRARRRSARRGRGYGANPSWAVVAPFLAAWPRRIAALSSAFIG
jgi:galactose-1-phosphate uridylyltransferase